MITVITGTPGSGKTLYSIQKLLRPMVGQTIPVPDDEGNVVDMPRTIYTNINGLQLDHERIDDGEEYGLRGWHNWALPGSVIVFDEFQKAWPPRPNGSKVPPDVQALDTHRHMGVDFILITQNSANVDRHVHGLVGRHLHIRRLANSPMATVYEWDHLSKSLLYSKALKMSPFFFSRKVYSLYKSAKVHTKQPRSLPGMIWFVAAGIAALAYFAPTFYGRMSDKFSDKPAQAQLDKKVISSSTTTTQGPPPGMVLTAAPGGSAAAAPDANTPERILPGVSGAPGQTAPGQTMPANSDQVAGCISIATRCKCFNAAGVELDQDEKQCKSLEGSPRQIGQWTVERNYFTPTPTPGGLHF